MSALITIYSTVSTYFCAQLPAPKEDDTDPTPVSKEGEVDPKIKKIRDKIDSAFTETKKRKGAKTDTVGDLSRDPLKTRETPKVKTRRTQAEQRERDAIIALTRNPSLPDYGRAYNAGLKEDFELNFGGIYTQDALKLVTDAIKPKSEGGLGLKLNVGEDGFPDGTFSNGTNGSRFMLQPQDGSIFIQYTIGKSKIPFGGATYTRKFNPETKRTEWVLDEKRTEPLPGTEGLSRLCTYPLQGMGSYTMNLAANHRSSLGFSGIVDIVPEVDGSLSVTEYESKSRLKVKRSGVYYNNNGTWKLIDADPFRTTQVIRRYNLQPIQTMKTFDFYKLAGFDPSKYKKEINDLIANANNLVPKKPAIPRGRPVVEELPQILPSVFDAHIQAYRDPEGNHYIATKHEVYRLVKTKEGTKLEMYNFEGKNKGFTEATGSKLYQALYLLRYGNFYPEKPILA